MKNLLILGAALLGLCAVGQTTRAGEDGPYYRDERPAPRYYEGRIAEERCYLPPPPPVFFPPPPRVVFCGHPHYYHRRHFYPYAYGCAPGIHIGIGL